MAGEKEVSVRVKINIDAADIDAAVNAMTAKIKAGLAGAFGQNFDPFAQASKSLDTLIQKSRTLGQATRSGTSGGTSIDRELDAMNKRIKLEDQLETRASRRFDQDINRSRQEMAAADRMYQQAIAGEEKLYQAKLKSMQVSQQLQEMNARTVANQNMVERFGAPAAQAYVQQNSTISALSVAQQAQANSNQFRQQYGRGVGGIVNAAGQQALGDIGIPGALATGLATASPLIGAAVDGVKDIAKYFGEAYDRTKELTNNVGRMQRIMGGTAQDAGRLYSALRLIGQEDNVFATITFNQIQASLARQQQIRAGTLTANAKDEQFAAGVSDVGINTAGIKTFNDFALQLSEKLQGLEPTKRSEAVQNIGGLFGQDLANLVGFSPDVLKQVLSQQVEITQADLKNNEQRQLAYTKAETAVANFEAALTRAAVPLDVMAQTGKAGVFTGLTGLAKVAQGGQAKDSERGPASSFLDILSSFGGLAGIIGPAAKQGTGYKLWTDAQLKDLEEHLSGPFENLTLLERLAQNLAIGQTPLEQVQQERAQRRMEGLAVAGDTRDMNAYPGGPTLMTRSGLEAGLKELGDIAKVYGQISDKITKLEDSLKDLNKAYYGQADAGFKQLLTGADAVDQQFKDYAKITTALAKTPEFVRVTKNVMSDGTVTYGSSGVAGKAKKPVSATTLVNQQQAIEGYVNTLANADQLIAEKQQALDKEVAKAAKGKATSVDVGRYQRALDNQKRLIGNAAEDYRAATGNAYAGPGAGTAGGLVSGAEPGAPTVVSSSTYTVRNKKFDQLTKDQADFLKQFNGQGLDTIETVFDDYSKFLIDAGKGNTDMFLNFRNQGVDAITGIAKAAGKVDFGFLEQASESALKLKLYSGQIDFKEFAAQTQQVRANFLDIGSAAQTPKKFTANSLLAAGLITEEQANAVGFDAKKFAKTQDYKDQLKIEQGKLEYQAALQGKKLTPKDRKALAAQAGEVVIANNKAAGGDVSEIQAAVLAAQGNDFSGVLQLASNKFLDTGKPGSTKGQDPGKRAYQLQYELQAIITGKDGKETSIQKELDGLTTQLSAVEKEFNDKKLKVGITAEISAVNLDAVNTAIAAAKDNIDGQLAAINKTLQVNITVSVNAPPTVYVPGPQINMGPPTYSGGSGGSPPDERTKTGGSGGASPDERSSTKSKPKNVLTRAGGGHVPRGRMTLVGEEGPEFIVPQENGHVFTASETKKLLAIYDQFDKSMTGSPFPKSLAQSPYAGLPDGASAAVKALGYDFGGWNRKALLGIETYKATGSLKELERLRQLARQSPFNPTDLQARQQSANQSLAINNPLGIQMAAVVAQEQAAAAAKPAPLAPLDLLFKLLNVKKPDILDKIIKKPGAPAAGRGGGGRSYKAMASGGVFNSGDLTLVGEEGPELIVPQTDGHVFTAAETEQLLKGYGDFKLSSQAMTGLSPESIAAQLGLDQGPYASKAFAAIREFQRTGSKSALNTLQLLARKNAAYTALGWQNRQIGGAPAANAPTGGGGGNNSNTPSDESIGDAIGDQTGTGAALDALAALTGVSSAGTTSTVDAINQIIANGGLGDNYVGSSNRMIQSGKALGGSILRNSRTLVGERGPELIASGDARSMLMRLAGGGMDLATGGVGRMSMVTGGAYSPTGGGVTVVNVDARGADSPVTTVAAVKRTAEQLFMSNALGDRRQARRAGRQDK